MRDLDVSALDVDGIPQFDLPLVPFARGDYHIEIRATAGRTSAESQLVTTLPGGITGCLWSVWGGWCGGGDWLVGSVSSFFAKQKRSTGPPESV